MQKDYKFFILKSGRSCMIVPNFEDAGKNAKRREGLCYRILLKADF